MRRHFDLSTRATQPFEDVLLVDDILESGLTLSFAKSMMTERGARLHRNGGDARNEEIHLHHMRRAREGGIWGLEEFLEVKAISAWDSTQD